LSGILKRISLNIAVIEKSCVWAYSHTFLVFIFPWLHFASNLSTSSYSFTTHCYKSFVSKDFSSNENKLSTSSCYTVFPRKNFLLVPIFYHHVEMNVALYSWVLKAFQNLILVLIPLKLEKNFFLFENIKLFACSFIYTVLL
jgi:hypothetical protein